MPASKIRVTGKVQGVFFRASTQEKAKSLHLCGWVRNESDGSVLIHAEGDKAAIQELLDWCHQGPPQASVQAVQVEEASKEGLSDFNVRR